MGNFSNSGKKGYLSMLLACCLCMVFAFPAGVPAAEEQESPEEKTECSVYFACPEDIRITGMKDGSEINQVKGNGCVIFEEDYPNGYCTYVKRGKDVSEPEVRSHTRTVLGWTEGIDGQTPFDFSTPITEDIELYPILDQYVVRFWDKSMEYGREYPRSMIYVKAGETVKEQGVEDRKYFNLKGWSLDERYGWADWNAEEDDPSQLFDFSQPINRECSLYACWEKDYDYEIDFEYPYDFIMQYFSYDIDRGIYANHGETLQDIGVPEVWYNGKRTILGWTTKDGTPVDFSAPVTEDLKLYPVTDKFRIKMMVQWEAEDDLFGDVEDGFVSAGEVFKEPVWRENPKWNFYGWTYGYERNEETGELVAKKYDFNTPVTSDLFLQADVERNWYGLHFLYNYAGYGDNGRCHSDQYDCCYHGGDNEYNCNQIRITRGDNAAAAEASVGIPKITGLIFDGWYLDEAGTVPFDFHAVLTGDTVVYAKWKTNEEAVITPDKEPAPEKEPAPPSEQKDSDKKIKTKKLVISSKKLTVKKGKKATLTVTRVPKDATDQIKWSSSNKKVASVNQKGRVTAKKKGKAVITAKSENGKKVTCKITVK